MSSHPPTTRRTKVELWGRTEVASATTPEGTSTPWIPRNVRIYWDPDSVFLNSQSGRKFGMQWPTSSWNSSCSRTRSLQLPCHVPSWGLRSPLVHSKIPKFLFQGVQIQNLETPLAGGADPKIHFHGAHIPKS